MYAEFDCTHKAAICTVSDFDAWGGLTLVQLHLYALVRSAKAIVIVCSLHEADGVT